jgi:hypothetical protein
VHDQGVQRRELAPQVIPQLRPLDLGGRRLGPALPGDPRDEVGRTVPCVRPPTITRAVRVPDARRPQYDLGMAGPRRV